MPAQWAGQENDDDREWGKPERERLSINMGKSDEPTERMMSTPVNDTEYLM
jgi:hypothetical protein